MRPSRDENIMRCETSQPPVSLRRRRRWRRRRRRRGWFAFILITPALSSPPFHYIATLGVVCVVVWLCVCVLLSRCAIWPLCFCRPWLPPDNQHQTQSTTKMQRQPNKQQTVASPAFAASVALLASKTASAAYVQAIACSSAN